MARDGGASLGPLLRALISEVTQSLPDELRAAAAVRVGTRLAALEPLAHGDSLVALEQAMGDWLARQGWGWVRLRDRGDWLEIEHRCHPLRPVLGDQAAVWAASLLGGLLLGWLRDGGADASLQLRSLGPAVGIDEALRYAMAVPAVHARLANHG